MTVIIGYVVLFLMLPIFLARIPSMMSGAILIAGTAERCDIGIHTSAVLDHSAWWYHCEDIRRILYLLSNRIDSCTPCKYALSRVFSFIQCQIFSIDAILMGMFILLLFSISSPVILYVWYQRNRAFYLCTNIVMLLLLFKDVSYFMTYV
uniref:Uncharacterized protein n=1 Tax=Glossina palpalis gambiensis TaxID=67801 RepID=A0A1B0B9T2_9MUSC